jgi:hypothetical protein
MHEFVRVQVIEAPYPCSAGEPEQRDVVNPW